MSDEAEDAQDSAADTGETGAGTAAGEPAGEHLETPDGSVDGTADGGADGTADDSVDDSVGGTPDGGADSGADGAAPATTRTYVVGDVHGHRDGLAAALRAHGLLDESDDWTGGESTLWFLGDFVDRGPDGIGVIDLVMRLAGQAEQAGGAVHTLLGNHEILLLGMYHFGDTEVPSDFGPRSFARSWQINGGLAADQDGLTEEHVEWLSTRPLLATAADHLLMHSDTLEYLDWGSDIEEINKTGAAILAGTDLSEWWEIWRRMTTRYAFRGPDGPEVAQRVLDLLGGERIVHGHSVIADQLGIHPALIEGPYLYAGGRVLGVDGGLFVGGPCLVVELPWRPED